MLSSSLAISSTLRLSPSMAAVCKVADVKMTVGVAGSLLGGVGLGFSSLYSEAKGIAISGVSSETVGNSGVSVAASSASSSFIWLIFLSLFGTSSNAGFWVKTAAISSIVFNAAIGLLPFCLSKLPSAKSEAKAATRLTPLAVEPSSIISSFKVLTIAAKTSLAVLIASVSSASVSALISGEVVNKSISAVNKPRPSVALILVDVVSNAAMSSLILTLPLLFPDKPTVNGSALFSRLSAICLACSIAKVLSGVA